MSTNIFISTAFRANPASQAPHAVFTTNEVRLPKPHSSFVHLLWKTWGPALRISVASRGSSEWTQGCSTTSRFLFLIFILPIVNVHGLSGHLFAPNVPKVASCKSNVCAVVDVVVISLLSCLTYSFENKSLQLWLILLLHQHSNLRLKMTRGVLMPCHPVLLQALGT